MNETNTTIHVLLDVLVCQVKHVNLRQVITDNLKYKFHRFAKANPNEI
jgi:hypothetical protein